MKKNVKFSQQEIEYLRDLYETANGVATTSDFLEKHGEGEIKIGDFAGKFAGAKLHHINERFESDRFSGEELKMVSVMAIVGHVHLLKDMGMIPPEEEPMETPRKLGVDSIAPLTELYLKMNWIIGDRKDSRREKEVLQKAGFK